MNARTAPPEPVAEAPGDHADTETPRKPVGTPELYRSLAEVKGQAQFLLYLADQIEESLQQFAEESDASHDAFLCKVLSMYSGQLEAEVPGARRADRRDLPGGLRHRPRVRRRLRSRIRSTRSTVGVGRDRCRVSGSGATIRTGRIASWAAGARRPPRDRGTREHRRATRERHLSSRRAPPREERGGRVSFAVLLGGRRVADRRNFRHRCGPVRAQSASFAGFSCEKSRLYGANSWAGSSRC